MPANWQSHRRLEIDRRRDCHVDDTPLLSLLKYLLKVEGGAVEWQPRRRQVVPDSGVEAQSPGHDLRRQIGQWQAAGGVAEQHERVWRSPKGRRHTGRCQSAAAAAVASDWSRRDHNEWEVGRGQRAVRRGQIIWPGRWTFVDGLFPAASEQRERESSEQRADGRQ